MRQFRQFFARPPSCLDHEIFVFGEAEPGKFGKGRAPHALNHPGTRRQDAKPVSLFGSVSRPRRGRKHERKHAEQEESPPVHVWMAPALQEIVIGEAQSSPAVMCPAC